MNINVISFDLYNKINGWGADEKGKWTMDNSISISILDMFGIEVGQSQQIGNGSSDYYKYIEGTLFGTSDKTSWDLWGRERPTEREMNLIEIDFFLGIKITY